MGAFIPTASVRAEAYINSIYHQWNFNMFWSSSVTSTKDKIFSSYFPRLFHILLNRLWLKFITARNLKSSQVRDFTILTSLPLHFSLKTMAITSFLCSKFFGKTEGAPPGSFSSGEHVCARRLRHYSLINTTILSRSKQAESSVLGSGVMHLCKPSEQYKHDPEMPF